jgi:hypothetical protein
MEILAIKGVTAELGFGKEKMDRQRFYALMCQSEQLEAFVEYFIAKKPSNSESGNLE